VCNLVQPGRYKAVVGLQLWVADKAQLRRLAECRRPYWHTRLLALRMQYGRVLRAETEQRARIQADSFDALVEQQAVQGARPFPTCEELRVPHLHRQRRAEVFNQPRQLIEPSRSERSE